MTTLIADLRETSNPFEDDFGCDTYASLDSMIGKTIDIYAVKAFENDKGPGVYILAKEPGKDFVYMCTHSVGITAMLTTERAEVALKDDTIRCTVVRRKSQKSDRQVYSLE